MFLFYKENGETICCLKCSSATYIYLLLICFSIYLDITSIFFARLGNRDNHLRRKLFLLKFKIQFNNWIHIIYYLSLTFLAAFWHHSKHYHYHHRTHLYFSVLLISINRKSVEIGKLKLLRDYNIFEKWVGLINSNIQI